MTNKLKVYYAHFMGIYNTEQEKRDIELLESLGFEIINPNNKSISERFGVLLDVGTPYLAAFNKVFGELVRDCDLLAFRSLPDGSISSGVYMEIEYAKDSLKPIIELPSRLTRRKLSKEETIEALKEFGVR